MPIPSGSGFGGGYDGFKLGAAGAPVQLEAFVTSHQAKTRVFVSLRWFVKNLHLPWPMSEVLAPSVKAKQ